MPAEPTTYTYADLTENPEEKFRCSIQKVLRTLNRWLPEVNGYPIKVCIPATPYRNDLVGYIIFEKGVYEILCLTQEFAGRPEAVHIVRITDGINCWQFHYTFSWFYGNTPAIEGSLLEVLKQITDSFDNLLMYYK